MAIHLSQIPAKENEGLSIIKNVYETEKNLLGENHSITIQTLCDYGKCLFHIAATHQDRALYKDAETVLLQALQSSLESLGPENNCTLSIKRALSEISIILEKPEEALSYCQAIYDTRQQTLGENNPCTLAAEQSVVLALAHAGRLEESIVCAENLYKKCIHILGTNHPTTLEIAQILAVEYFNSGQTENAKQLDELIYLARKEVLGENHINTIWSEHQVAFNCFWFLQM
ncbi:MAG: tetratricopeptide repeat protein [Lachnospiraceae bacterium]|nr:tetratricopeptide repeat protein [Lachnospiraceae bacterium]MDD3617062.1 tetratricopeptide repeat protein [Lachnospiraceae bacterium]